MKKVLLGCGGLIILFFACGIVFALFSGDDDVNVAEVDYTELPGQEFIEPEAIEVKEECITIDAEDLYSAFEENELNANKLYEKKCVVVSGVVRSVGEDIIGSPYVSLRGNEYFGDVQCMLDSSAKEYATTLREGDDVTFTGKVSGYLMNVLVRGCK